jgi:hypothetical protein
MLLPSAVGWIVGMAWRAELLPGLSPASHGFRVPAWMVGERERRSGAAGSAGGAAGGGGGGASAAERERFEDLRRRLEGEVAASASGMENGGRQRRRGAGSGIMERLRGAW